MSSTDSSANPKEVAKFSAMSEKWWDINGPLRTLHEINCVRVNYLKKEIIGRFPSKKLSQMQILDVGCGGGLVAEEFAKLGTTVTGIDASESNILIAKEHAKNQGLSITYICNTVEDLAKHDNKFDVVLCLEIIEHVDNIALFIESCCKMLSPDGLIFFATINRTVKSYALAIMGAEYVLRWLPIGTHSWSKFLKPSEIDEELRKNGLKTIDITGLEYHFLSNNKWALSRNTAVNYILMAQNQ